MRPGPCGLAQGSLARFWPGYWVGGRGHSHVFLKRAEGRVIKLALKYTEMLLALARDNSRGAQRTHGYAIYSRKGKWPCQDDLH